MRKIISSAAALILAVFSLHCSADPSGPQEIEQLPRELDGAEIRLIEADNAFGLKLFRQVQSVEGSKNTFISPLSVAMALGMTYNGAAGTTQAAMRETLELQGLTIEEVNASYRSLIDLLAGLDPSVQFLLVNSIWYRSGFSVQQEFLDVNQTYFDAQVAALDFDNPSAAETINDWVNDKTNGRIEDIVTPPIPAEIVMFLINAIYFKGDWTFQFDRELTQNRPFTLADGTTKQVPTMTYTEPTDVSYFADATVEGVDLSYGGKAYSMTILLPAEGRDVEALVASLNAARWAGILAGFATIEANVLLPKFTLEYEIEMNDVLKALGMAIAFDPDNADFSNIYSGPERLFISKVKHKSFVDVNEQGTEAAAVTSVEVGVTSLPPTIAVDRPFVFAIRERFSGTILFMGVITDPSQSS